MKPKIFKQLFLFVVSTAVIFGVSSGTIFSQSLPCEFCVIATDGSGQKISNALVIIYYWEFQQCVGDYSVVAAMGYTNNAGEFCCTCLINDWPLYIYASGGCAGYGNYDCAVSRCPNIEPTTVVCNINPPCRSMPLPKNTFYLSQNFPNPFNPLTMIEYQIPNKTWIILKVYDAAGAQIRTLISEEEQAGIHNAVFDGGNLPSGMYFYTLEAGMYRESRKMLLLK